MPTAKRAKTAVKSVKKSKAKDAAGDSGEPAIVIVGNHPSALIAAVKLAAAGVATAIVDVGNTPLPDRLVAINPELFALVPQLVSDRPPASDLEGIVFHRAAGTAAQTTKDVGKGLKATKGVTGLASVCSLSDLTTRLRRIVEEVGQEGVAPQFISGQAVAEEVDETGLVLKCGRQTLRPKLMIAADPLPDSLAVAVGAKAAASSAASSSTLAIYEIDSKLLKNVGRALHVALDLTGESWGWLMTSDTDDGPRAQLQVQHPPSQDSTAVLREWAGRLYHAGLLKDATVDGRSVRTAPLAPAGALQRDVVARRTLLVGPAGGFYSSSGEDVYPACWSASIAADIAAKAIKAAHVQDALGAYRGKWGASLGEYLQGPQQNLRFLMPLVFKNPVMTDRLAESILRGQSLVK